MSSLIFLSLIIVITNVGICKCVMEAFIVGGQYANRRDFPYAAHLAIECRTKRNLLGLWICGSSIINQYIVLTAGHCLYSCGRRTKISINVGSTDIIEGAVSSAHAFLIHESYSERHLENDIGLVKIKTPLEFNDKVGRVALLRKPPYKGEAVVAGWGLVNEENREQTNILQFTKQHVWKLTNCIDLLHFMPKGTFCAENKNRTSYASLGDSGSALIVRKYIQLGLVSCKDYDKSLSVVIYTDIGYFYDWITKNIKDFGCTRIN